MDENHKTHLENVTHDASSTHPKSSSSNKYLVIGLIAVLIFAIIGLIYFLTLPKNNPPQIQENSVKLPSLAPSVVEPTISTKAVKPTIPYKEEYQNPFNQKNRQTEYKNPFE